MFLLLLWFHWPVYVGATKTAEDFEKSFEIKKIHCLQWLYDSDVEMKHKGFLEDLHKSIKKIEGKIDDNGRERKFLRTALDGFFMGCVYFEHVFAAVYIAGVVFVVGILSDGSSW